MDNLINFVFTAYFSFKGFYYYYFVLVFIVCI